LHRCCKADFSSSSASPYCADCIFSVEAKSSSRDSRSISVLSSSRMTSSAAVAAIADDDDKRRRRQCSSRCCCYSLRPPPSPRHPHHLQHLVVVIGTNGRRSPDASFGNRRSGASCSLLPPRINASSRPVTSRHVSCSYLLASAGRARPGRFSSSSSSHPTRDARTTVASHSPILTDAARQTNQGEARTGRARGGSRERNRMRVRGVRFGPLTRFGIPFVHARQHEGRDFLSLSLSLSRQENLFFFTASVRALIEMSFFFLSTFTLRCPRAIIYSRSNIIVRSTVHSIIFFYTCSFISFQIPLAIRCVKNICDWKVLLANNKKECTFN